MPSLREAMKSVAQNTSRLLSPDLQKKVNAALIDMEKKYEEAQARLRAALYDKVSLENEVLYLKSKLDEAKQEVKSLKDRATKAVAPPTKKAQPKAKPKPKTPAKKTKTSTKKKK
jgi:predicted nuclease with TOPRIM domain